MRVVILGGYGVFGSRLAGLLVRDEHELWIVGRDQEKADALRARLGARSLIGDVRISPEVIFDCKPDVVVDAAGPFQNYDDDPYLIPRMCIARGADYLDFSDSAEFTSGIAVLHEVARGSGRCVLFGVSCPPCRVVPL